MTSEKPPIESAPPPYTGPAEGTSPYPPQAAGYPPPPQGGYGPPPPQGGYPPPPQGGYGPPPQGGYGPPPQSGYGPPPQGGYGPPPPGGYAGGPSPYGPPPAGGAPPVSTVIIHQGMQPYAYETSCPQCGERITTSTDRSPGVMAWLSCIGCLCVGLWAGCCLIPFCVDSCYDVTHRCPKCKHVIGEYRQC